MQLIYLINSSNKNPNKNLRREYYNTFLITINFTFLFRYSTSKKKKKKMKEKDEREKNLCERNEDRYGPLTPARSSVIHRKWDFSWHFQRKYRVRGSSAVINYSQSCARSRIDRPRVDRRVF